MHFDTPTPMHTTPTIITEAFHLVACVQLFKGIIKVKVTAYTVIAYSYQVSLYNELQL